MRGILRSVGRRPVCLAASAAQSSGRLRDARVDPRRAGLGEEVDRLRVENARLRARLEEARREGKRQAAPFSKGEPKKDPARAGRRSGELHGRHGHRPVPDRVDEEIGVPLPDACPCCGSDDWSTATRSISTSRTCLGARARAPVPVSRERCRGCGRPVQGRDPRQTSDATGAAGSQVGPQAITLAAQLQQGAGDRDGQGLRDP